MLFKNDTMRGIKSGEITLAFRKWIRPQVKQGGSQKTSIGVLGIESVDRIDADEITDLEAKRSGHANAAALLAILNERSDGEIFRIRFHLAGRIRLSP